MHQRFPLNAHMNGTVRSHKLPKAKSLITLLQPADDFIRRQRCFRVLSKILSELAGRKVCDVIGYAGGHPGQERLRYPQIDVQDNDDIDGKDDDCNLVHCNRDEYAVNNEKFVAVDFERLRQLEEGVAVDCQCQSKQTSDDIANLIAKLSGVRQGVSRVKKRIGLRNL